MEKNRARENVTDAGEKITETQVDIKFKNCKTQKNTYTENTVQKNKIYTETQVTTQQT